jgi:THAP4-like, heme-binding beta-barrel domain
MPELHPDVAHLAFLLGVWSGEGEGDYPTTSPFKFRETLRFEDVGDTFLLYSQESWTLDGEPLHFERGTFRPSGPGRVEVTLAHPNGLVEIAEGELAGSVMDLRSTTVARTSTGSAVTALARRYRVSGDELSYQIDMSMDEVPSTLHVWATLRRS